MTLADFDDLDTADRAEAHRSGRTEAILRAPEALATVEQSLLALELLLRLDLPPDAVRLLLRHAPALRSANDVIRWVGAIPVHPHPETRH